MKNNQYPIKKILGYILSISSILFICIIFYKLHSKDLKINSHQQNQIYSNSYSTEMTSHSVNNTCEIVISEKDDDYIKALQTDFPNCKIIEKNDLFQFDLINYLSNLFN